MSSGRLRIPLATAISGTLKAAITDPIRMNGVRATEAACTAVGQDAEQG